MERIKIYKDTSLKCLLEKLEFALLNVHKYINSPLAYNMMILAIVTDATHLRKVLEAMLRSWTKRLPFIGEEGMDVNWKEIQERLDTALGEFMKQKEDHHSIKVNVSCTPPEDLKNWRNWRNDYLNQDPRMNSHTYKKELNPVDQDNLWNFVTNDCWISNDTSKESLSNMLVFLRNMTEDSHDLLGKTLLYEMERILKVAENLETFFYFPSRLIPSEDKREILLEDFISRIHTAYEFKANMKKKEYMTWRDTLQDDITMEFLQQQKMLYWKKVADSGFLDNLKENCPYRAGDDNYMSLFFGEAGMKKRTAGCYIYTQQLKCTEWQKKVETFMIFVAVNEIIDEDMKRIKQEQSVPKKEREKKTKTQERYESIARCIQKLMEEKDPDEPWRNLFRQKNQWIAIHRVLSNFYGFARGCTEFCKQVEELGLEKLKHGCTQDGVSKIPMGILEKDIKDWEEHKEKNNPKNKPFLKQYHVAARLMEILEEEGVEKIFSEKSSVGNS